MKPEDDRKHTFRAGYVAIIGDPNVGKSTLLNAFLGQKISIVTNKPQTTRHKILGMFSRETYQVIFLDTPGVLKPKYLLQESMMKFALSAIDDADLVLFMIDASNPCLGKEIDHSAAFQIVKEVKKDIYLVINKVDLVKKLDIAQIIAFYNEQYFFRETFPISALHQSGSADLLDAIVEALPEHPPYYPLDAVSDQSERFFVSEIIREKIFEKFRDEIPYATAVDIVEFKEHHRKKDHINAEIYVERESQKGILIGNQGKALKEIGERSRKEIELFLGRPVFLELRVKVREKWRTKKMWLNRLGYKI